MCLPPSEGTLFRDWALEDFSENHLSGNFTVSMYYLGYSLDVLCYLA